MASAALTAPFVAATVPIRGSLFCPGAAAVVACAPFASVGPARASLVPERARRCGAAAGPPPGPGGGVLAPLPLPSTGTIDSASRMRQSSTSVASSSSSSSGGGGAGAATAVATPPTEMEDKVLKDGIASFYDESSALWEDMWGEHMHHGYYPEAGSGSDGQVDHRQAQIDMIEKTLAWAGVDDAQPPTTAVDIGCGIGGSARYLARKYGTRVQAVTLSPRQAQRGNEICRSQGLGDLVTLQVADAMAAPFPDNSFDLVWSMESGEHMPDKPKFVRELARLVAPGGRIIIVTWCHRDLDTTSGETQLKDWEQAILDRICDAYYLPAWCSTADYIRLAKEAGLKDVRADDWSKYVTPFWPAVIASALTFRGFVGLLKAGWSTMRGALAMLLMVQGFSTGVIKFAIITAEKGDDVTAVGAADHA